MSTIGRGRFPFRSAWLFRPSRRSRSSSLERILKDTRFSHLDHNDDLVKRNFFFDAAPTIRERWVDTASSSGGNGTTSATTGANRAYASLSDAITAESATGTLADLVSANEYLVIHCNGSSADTTAVDIPSTVKTSSTCYVKIVVDQANRHDGKWNSGKYRLVTNGYFGSLVVRCDHFIGEGLQVENNATSVPDGSRHGISCRSTGSSGLFSIHECVVRYTGDYTNQDPHGISDNGRSSTNVITQIVNNVVYDFNKNLYMGSQSGDSYTLYHNTSVDPVVEGMTILRYGSGASFYVKNNIIQGSVTNYYTESATASLSTAGNVTEDATSPDSGGRNIAITFVNEAGNDFHTNDAAARSSTNLYADSLYPVTIDIDGNARPSVGNVYAGSDEGSSGYTLTAAQGSFSLSGQAAGLRAARTITAAQGSFSLAGQAAILRRGVTVTAAQGSFSLSGQAAVLKATRVVTAAQGSFSLSGQAAILKVGHILTASQGSFVLSGQAAILRRGYALVSSQGSFVLTGQSANLLRALRLTAAQGSFALSGQAAALKRGLRLTAAQGAFTLTGQSANLVYSPSNNFTLSAGQGSFTLTGQAANLLRSRLFTASQGSFVLSGQPAALKFGRRVTAVQGSFVLSGQPVNLLYARRLVSAQGSFALSGQAALLLRGRRLTAAQGVYVLTGQAAQFRWNRVIIASHGIFVLSGKDAALVYALVATNPISSFHVEHREFSGRDQGRGFSGKGKGRQFSGRERVRS